MQRPQLRPRFVPGRGWVTFGNLDWKGIPAGLHHDRNEDFHRQRGWGRGSRFHVEELEKLRCWPWARERYASGKCSETCLKGRAETAQELDH